MKTKFQQLRNDLENLEDQDPSEQGINRQGMKTGGTSGKVSNYILLFAFLITLVFYAGSRITLPSVDGDTIESIFDDFNRPDQAILDGMGDWMQEMGYGELTDDELIDLRRQGVTATYTSQIRDIGYTDVTLDQLVDLQDASVSTDYTRMMKELGYELSIDDLIRSRENNVTAYFTSNMMDLGYTFEELTLENLIRMRSLGVTHNLAERLTEQNGERPSIDDLIKYRISNQ